MLRYQEDNELHRDFHGTTNTTIQYMTDHYGVDALKESLQKTGRDVYKSIHDKLAKGDASELIEHLNWFYHREGTPYKLEVSSDFIRLEVLECPAVKHLRESGFPRSEHFCLQTSEVNIGMCENTPWTCTVEIISEGHCIQYFKKVKS